MKVPQHVKERGRKRGHDKHEHTMEDSEPVTVTTPSNATLQPVYRQTNKHTLSSFTLYSLIPDYEPLEYKGTREKKINNM